MKWRKILSSGLILLGLCGFPILSQAAILDNLKDQLTYAEQQLQLTKENLQSLQATERNSTKEKSEQWLHFNEEGITEADIKQCEFTLADMQAVTDNMMIVLTNSQESIKVANESWINLKRQYSSLNTNLTLNLAAERAEQRSLLLSIIKTEHKRIEYLKQNRTIILRRLEGQKRWCQQLQSLYQSQIQQRQSSGGISVKVLQQQQQNLMRELILLNNQFVALNEPTPQMQSQRLAWSFDIFVLRERISINQLEMFLAQLRVRVQPAALLDPESMTVMELDQQIKKTEDTINNLNKIILFTKDKIQFIKKQQTMVLVTTASPKIFSTLLHEYQQQLEQLREFHEQMRNYQEQLVHIHQQQFMVRQKLPLFTVGAWKELLQQIWAIPQFFWHFIKGISIQIIYQLKNLNGLVSYYFFLGILLLIPSWIFLRKTFRHWLLKLEERSQRFSSQVLTVFLLLIRRNLGTILIIAALLGLFIFFGIDTKLWLLLAAIVLSYRIVTTLARLWLLENETDVAGKDVRLYRGLRWIFSLSGIAIVFVMLAHTFPINYEVKVLFNKILMMLLLGLSLLLLRSWSVLPNLLQRVFVLKRRYILRVIHLFCVVVPITLLTNALIGLLGYVELAWTIAKYQVIALLTMVIYMIARGLLIDLIELSYGGLIRYFKAGWLWAQAFIRPIDRILRIVLLVLMIWIFIHWSGLDKNATLIEYWKQLMTLPLIKGIGRTITLPLLVWVTIFIAVLYWLSKWSREFAFRWLYKRARDVGVRNSLSVFTQYAVVIAGVVMGLRIFGFDLTGLTVIAAAFVAGVGFGLRDILSNFFSGVLLLVERPFRAGDTITIGTHEGEVISTGMRSLKMRTWDHMEVIVPNADMFSKPFVNWTHQDKIVRSVACIKVHPEDNPHKIQELILNLLYKIPSVVDNPEPEVFMTEMNDALIEIEIRFYLNLQTEQSRSRVRSEVLFAIWDCFKEHNIRTPFVRYDINMLNK